jgi:hypothetical protein
VEAVTIGKHSSLVEEKVWTITRLSYHSEVLFVLDLQGMPSFYPLRPHLLWNLAASFGDINKRKEDEFPSWSLCDTSSLFPSALSALWISADQRHNVLAEKSSRFDWLVGCARNVLQPDIALSLRLCWCYRCLSGFFRIH